MRCTPRIAASVPTHSSSSSSSQQHMCLNRTYVRTRTMENVSVLQNTLARAREEHVCSVCVCVCRQRWCAQLPGIRLPAHMDDANTHTHTQACSHLRATTRLIVKSHLADDVNWPRLLRLQCCMGKPGRASLCTCTVRQRACQPMLWSAQAHT